jgi:SAM-dependent methyltransferase
MEATGPNAEQIRYWSETAGPRWVAFGAELDRVIRPLGLAAMARAGLVAGERVLDVGCGCGDTSLELGRRVGPSGTVLGVDISAVMLEHARQRARAADMPQVRFENADAQTHPFRAGSVDVVFSRFGVMFFSDAVAAFTNLARALGPAGRLAFVCWQSLERNPWLRVPLLAASQHVALPPPPAPDAPGPFSLADDTRVRGILARAGFGQVACEALDTTLTLGSALDGAVDFALQAGPTAALLREASDAQRAAVTAAVHDALVPFQGAAGVCLPAAAWLVSGARDA